MRKKIIAFLCLFLFSMPSLAQANGSYTVLIPAGSSQSSPIYMPYGGQSVTNIIMPIAWNQANLTIFVSSDQGKTFQELFDGQGNEYSIATGLGRSIVVDPVVFSNIRSFYVQSGTTSSPVMQTSDRTLTLQIK